MVINKPEGYFCEKSIKKVLFLKVLHYKIYQDKINELYKKRRRN